MELKQIALRDAPGVAAIIGISGFVESCGELS